MGDRVDAAIDKEAPDLAHFLFGQAVMGVVERDRAALERDGELRAVALFGLRTELAQDGEHIGRREIGGLRMGEDLVQDGAMLVIHGDGLPGRRDETG